MAITFEVRQQVKTIQETWLEVVFSTSSDQLANSTFTACVKNHPCEYFELIRIDKSEEVLLSTPILRSTSVAHGGNQQSLIAKWLAFIPPDNQDAFLKEFSSI